MERLDELISLILGVFTPIIISWWKGGTWSKRTKFLLAFGISVFIGILTTLGTHQLILHREMTPDDWITNALVVFSTATATYKLYFEDSSVENTLESQGPFSGPKE